MPKEHRIPVLCIQIMLTCLAVLMFFVYFTASPPIPNFANPSAITGFVSLGMAMLLETVAYEKTPVKHATSPEATPKQTDFSEAFLKQANYSETPPEQTSFSEVFSAQARPPEVPSDQISFSEAFKRQTGHAEQRPDPTLVDRQNEATPQAKRLHGALNRREIYNELEFDDGYKHIDISIPMAKLNLEIDGKYHLTDPEHLFRDLKRDSYSHLDGIDTIRIPNFYVDNHLDEIANAIAEVARKRQECTLEGKRRRST